MGVGPEMGDEVKDRAISISPSPTLSFRDSIWHHHQDPSVALNSICIYVCACRGFRLMQQGNVASFIVSTSAQPATKNSTSVFCEGECKAQEWRGSVDIKELPRRWWESGSLGT